MPGELEFKMFYGTLKVKRKEKSQIFFHTCSQRTLKCIGYFNSADLTIQSKLIHAWLLCIFQTVLQTAKRTANETTLLVLSFPIILVIESLLIQVVRLIQ